VSEFVIDASAALVWLVRSQATGASAAFLNARDQDRFVAPHIFSWEVGNVLLSLHRRRALGAEAHRDVVTELRALEVAIEPALTQVEIDELSGFARQAGLSLFDTAYVALAIERSAPLVSQDDRLLAAAAAQGVDCIDLRDEGGA
jgi:predicted nucleic acid-binding protein